MEPLMPTVTGRSRPWTDHRLAVEGMAWKYRTGAPWRDVPERFGKWNSIYKRFNRWAENGTWEKLLAEVPDAGRRRREDRLGRVHRLHDRACASARRDPLAGHRGLCRITRIRGSSRLITGSAAPAAG